MMNIIVNMMNIMNIPHIRAHFFEGLEENISKNHLYRSSSVDLVNNIKYLRKRLNKPVTYRQKYPRSPKNVAFCRGGKYPTIDKCRYLTGTWLQQKTLRHQGPCEVSCLRYVLEIDAFEPGME